jgi:hypothetical protein
LAKIDRRTLALGRHSKLASQEATTPQRQRSAWHLPDEWNEKTYRKWARPRIVWNGKQVLVDASFRQDNIVAIFLLARPLRCTGAFLHCTMTPSVAMSHTAPPGRCFRPLMPDLRNRGLALGTLLARC